MPWALSVAERTRESAALSDGLFVRASATSRLMQSVVMTTTLVVSAGGVSLAACVFNTAALKSKIIPGFFISRSTHSHKNGHSEPAAAVAGHTTSGRKGISDQVRAVPLKNWDCCFPEERKSCRRRFDRWRRLQRQDRGDRCRQSLQFI